ncbi:hypothetical protein K438DRAFT_1967912 [Mycena galopus ATCC 62051]|nr:hypothetical protein K438DRAFT_1967912 [Mycena galopus ATCC 62051]
MTHPTAEDSALIQKLVDLSASKPKLVCSSKYAAPGDPDISVTSWKNPKMAELETDGQYPIIAPKYDKVSDVGEVGWSTLLGSLTLETTKHAVGPAKEKDKLSHAQAGEAWLRKAAPPRPEREHQRLQDAAARLVDTFADEWGFVTTASTELPIVAAVREFTSQVDKAGAWNCIPVGLRPHAGRHPPAGKPYATLPARPHHAPASSHPTRPSTPTPRQREPRLGRPHHAVRREPAPREGPGLPEPAREKVQEALERVKGRTSSGFLIKTFGFDNFTRGRAASGLAHASKASNPPPSPYDPFDLGTARNRDLRKKRRELGVAYK